MLTSLYVDSAHPKAPAQQDQYSLDPPLPSQERQSSDSPSSKAKTIFANAGSQLKITELPITLKPSKASRLSYTTAPAVFKGANSEETHLRLPEQQGLIICLEGAHEVDIAFLFPPMVLGPLVL
ncbi:hypothetical protein VNI00_013093 [Paramarasmius palmivorus]|uniref:Uncharacterized protein n=1 Tax=Paramarasmius palmivorus TaxID=297713 RepID=A0AAW0C185_9AGAR